MNVEPKCPNCGVPTQWNNSGSSSVRCPACLQSLATNLCDETLFEFSLWLSEHSIGEGFLSYFNVVALGLFQHATQFRADFPERSVSESWQSFTEDPSIQVAHASSLFELIHEGQWPEINAPHICERLHAIHDASFFGQWAIPLDPSKAGTPVFVGDKEVGSIPHGGEMKVTLDGLDQESLRKMFYGKEK